MRLKICILLSALCLFPFLQCSMFEDIELYSGMDIGNNQVDIYIDDGGAPLTLYISRDMGKNFDPIPLYYQLELWAVNKRSELLTVEFDSGSNTRYVYLRQPGKDPVQVGYFGGSDSVAAVTAGPDGEFYLCAYEGSNKKLYIFRPSTPLIQPIADISSITNNIVNIWEISFQGVINLYIVDASNTLHRLTDGGNSFNPVGIFTSMVYDMVYFNNEIYFSSAEATNSIYKTSDGYNFTQIGGSPGECTSLHVHKDRIYASTNNGIYFSSDGSNWTAGTNLVNVADIATDFTGRLYIASENYLYASDDGGVMSYTLNNFGFAPSKIRVVSYAK